MNCKNKVVVRREMADGDNNEMFWRSNNCFGGQTHNLVDSKHRDSTLSRTSIQLNLWNKKILFENPSTEKEYEKTRVADNQAHSDRHKIDLSRDVNVSLTISRNQNASINASCFFPQQQPNSSSNSISKSNNKRTHLPICPLLKIVEIPFEEHQANGASKVLQIRPIDKFELPKDMRLPSSKAPPISSSLLNDGETFTCQRRNGEDYRVISLNIKPCPGRLENFIPEIERGAKEHTSLHGEIIRNNSKTVYEPDERCMNISKIHTKNGDADEEIPSLERDDQGRLVIPSREWRKFMAEQRPQTTIPLKNSLQIIHHVVNSNGERKKPKIISVGTTRLDEVNKKEQPFCEE